MGSLWSFTVSTADTDSGMKRDNECRPPRIVTPASQGLCLDRPHFKGTGGQCPPHSLPSANVARRRQGHELEGETRCVTPRQACPRPEGLGRNLRSKTRWFTGFCNSHQVSHFATFFIDARAEISVAESRSKIGFRDTYRCIFPTEAGEREEAR